MRTKALLSAAALAATLALSSCSLIENITNGDEEVSQVKANVGDCVNLTGSLSDAKIEKATCGSVDSHYKVIAKGKDKASCPSDADQVYYETYGSEGSGALCLDTDWVLGKCFIEGGFSTSTKQAPCTDPSALKVVLIKEGTADSAQCPDDADKYVTHDVRKQLVCLARTS